MHDGATHVAQQATGDSATEARNVRPGAWSGARLALYSLLLAALLVGVAGASYYRYVRFDPVLSYHVPPGAQWAILLDVEKVPVFEPLRRQIIPLLGGLGTNEQATGSDGQATGSFALLRQREGINLLRDAREILVVGEKGGRWGVGIAGQFTQRDLIARVFDSLHLAERGWVLEREPHGGSLQAIYSQGSLGALQAADGAVFISSPASFAQQLAARRSSSSALLDCTEGEGCVGVSRSASWLGPALTSLGLPSATGKVQASLLTAQDFVIRLRYPSAPADWERSASPRALIDTMAQGLPPRDWGGERAVVSRLSWRREGKDLLLTSRWTRSEADRAARSFAAWLERNVRQGLVRPAEQR